ncbi:hypothetical protein CCMA1212_007061, partial [Trichoderma ghanense]
CFQTCALESQALVRVKTFGINRGDISSVKTSILSGYEPPDLGFARFPLSRGTWGDSEPSFKVGADVFALAYGGEMPFHYNIYERRERIRWKDTQEKVNKYLLRDHKHLWEEHMLKCCCLNPHFDTRAASAALGRICRNSRASGFSISIQLASAIYATAQSQEKCDLIVINTLGANAVIDTTDHDWVDQVIKATDVKCVCIIADHTSPYTSVENPRITAKVARFIPIRVDCVRGNQYGGFKMSLGSSKSTLRERCLRTKSLTRTS